MRKPVFIVMLSVVSLFAIAAFAQSKASMSEVVEAAMQPLETTPSVKYIASSGTSSELLVATVPSNQRTRRFSQEIAVENLGTSGSVCVYTVSAGAACSTDADASCRGGSDPKPVIPPGKSKKFRFAGLVDVCAITSAAAVEWQAERIINEVGAR